MKDQSAIFLFEELRERKKRNSKYSLRAFARDIGISHTSLSLVFNGSRKLNNKSKMQIAGKLKWGTEKTKRFIFSEFIDEINIDSIKSQFDDFITSIEVDLKRVQVNLEKDLRHWAAGAIFQLVGIQGFKNNPRWIAERIGLEVEEVERILYALFDSGLLEESENGKYKQSHEHVDIARNFKNIDEKTWTKEILRKGLLSLEEPQNAHLKLNYALFSYDKKSIDMVSKEMENMFKNLRQKLVCNKGDEVFQINLQLFQVSK